MYYSKRPSDSVAVPRNYSGSLFRVIDESDRSPDRTLTGENEPRGGENCPCGEEKGRQAGENRPCGGENRGCGEENGQCEREICEKNGCKCNHHSTLLGSVTNILSDISTEELLLLGLIFVIHRDDPNDPILLALLALLVTK